MGTLQNQTGFTAVESLLIVLVLAVIGFGGYYVWHTQQQNSTKASKTTQSPSTTAVKTSTLTTTTQPTDPTASWTAFTSKAGGYSVKYPQGWFTVNTAHPECPTSPTTYIGLDIGPSKDTAGNCGLGGQSEVSIGHTAAYADKYGNCSSTGAWGKSYFTQASSQSVEIAGMKATKYTGTTNGTDVNKSSTADLGPTGTKITEYCFANGFDAVYAQHPSWSDVSSDFTLMVTNTLKFN